MKRLLGEPLVHFILLGAAIFACAGFLTRAGRGKERIVVSAGQIEHLSANFQRTWLRPPTPSELDGLIQDYLRDEVAYREALALGLDRDDTVIRRRLRQKMEFISEDAAAAEPSDEELGAYLAEHAESFRVEQSFTFSQVYLDPTRHGARLGGEVARLLAHLRDGGAGDDLRDLGDATLLQTDFREAARSSVAQSFGDEFAAELAKMPTGEWRGPVPSAYGVHIVLLRARGEPTVPPLEDIRDAVRREWANARRVAATEKLYRSLLERYTVTVERAAPVEEAQR